jgi:D-alanine-D-alanine ligase
MTARIIRQLVFVQSVQPEIYRGWHISDAKSAAHDLGFVVSEANLDNTEALMNLVAGRTDIMIWPVCYTLGGDVDAPLLTVALESLGVPFVGASAADVLLSSKIAFKATLSERTTYPSPAYELLVPPWSAPRAEIGYPAMVKTEYSANSEGVRPVRSQEELIMVCNWLSERYGQRLFIERWERQREHTVAFIPAVGDEGPWTAALEIAVLEGRDHIDSVAKNDNSLLAFRRPEEHLARELETCALEIATNLGIDGYCRLDFVQNQTGAFFPIEANFLPYLTRYPPSQSYFPMAFEFGGSLTYMDIIKLVILHALERSGADVDPLIRLNLEMG